MSIQNRRFGDRWEEVESLGKGGQGEVFKVRDVQEPDPFTESIKNFETALAQMELSSGGPVPSGETGGESHSHCD